MVDYYAVFFPLFLEYDIEAVFFSVVPNSLKAALGLRNGAIQFVDFLLRRSDLGRIRRQEIATLDGTEIRREVVQIPEHTGVRQPQVGYVRGKPVEVAQARDAEQTKNDDKQKEEQEDRSELETDRTRLPHYADHHLVKI